MDGIHDLGGKHGFGAVVPSADEAPFEERWQGAVFTIVRSMYASGVAHNVDYFRHAVERIDPVSYLTDSYYGRWLGALETMLVEAGVLTQQDITNKAVALGAHTNDRVAARPRGAAEKFPTESEQQSTAFRPIEVSASFRPGDLVRATNVGVPGHTRLPSYVRGALGKVVAQHGGWVFPDSNAHGYGEQPQHLYTVAFSGSELWGPAGDANLEVCVDLFESYLEVAS